MKGHTFWVKAVSFSVAEAAEVTCVWPDQRWTRPQQTLSEPCKLAKKPKKNTRRKNRRGKQMPKQKQRNWFSFSFFPSTLGTSGYSHFFRHWVRLWRSSSIRCQTRQTNQPTWALLWGQRLPVLYKRLSEIPVWLHTLLNLLKHAKTQGRNSYKTAIFQKEIYLF